MRRCKGEKREWGLGSRLLPYCTASMANGTPSTFTGGSHTIGQKRPKFYGSAIQLQSARSDAISRSPRGCATMMYLQGCSSFLKVCAERRSRELEHNMISHHSTSRQRKLNRNYCLKSTGRSLCSCTDRVHHVVRTRLLLTHLVSEDVGQHAGLLLQSRHTGENLRAALHHVCRVLCRPFIDMSHVRRGAPGNQRSTNPRGSTLRHWCFKPRHGACKGSAATQQSPKIEGRVQRQELNTERGVIKNITVNMSLLRWLTRRVLVGVVEILVDLHGVIALRSVRNQREAPR